MSELPERIWFDEVWTRYSEQGDMSMFTGYIRADVAQAMVAAAYARASTATATMPMKLPASPRQAAHAALDAAEASILTLTPTDARAALDAMLAKAREDALREAAERIDRKIKQVQPEMTRRAQRLAERKKPGFQYAIHRADLDARMSDRDMILALIDRTAEDTNHD